MLEMGKMNLTTIYYITAISRFQMIFLAVDMKNNGEGIEY